MASSTGEVEKLEKRWAENQLGLTFAPLAEAYRKAGDPARALQLLSVGLAQHPNYIPAHIVRGRCYLDTQADGDAELSFLKVTELDPENVIALKSLAEISERAGRLGEATRRLEMLLDVDRNNEEARGQLDRVREREGEVGASAGVVTSPLASEPVASLADSPVTLPDLVPAIDFLEPSIHRELAEPAPSGAPEPVPPAVPANEFQLPSDAETLLPADDRMEDIELGADEYPGLETSPAFSSPMLEEPPALELHQESAEPVMPESGSATSWREELDEEPVEAQEEVPERAELEVPVAAAEEPKAEPVSEAAPEPEPVPMVMETPVPIVDVQPPPPPTPEPAAEWESVAAPEPEPLGVEETAAEESVAPAASTESGLEAEPELVVTETMAEIFLRQGHRELALAVYLQLSQRAPEDTRLTALVSGLQAELTPPAPPPPPAPPAPRFAAAETGGRSVASLFGSLLTASRPAVAAAVHPPAFETPRRPSGEPTRPAQDTLSLSAVFGDEQPAAGPASAGSGPADGREPSFDEFFTGAGSSDAELPKGPPPEAAAPASQIPEDLEQFNAWLRGLKR